MFPDRHFVFPAGNFVLAVLRDVFRAGQFVLPGRHFVFPTRHFVLAAENFVFPDGQFVLPAGNFVLAARNFADFARPQGLLAGTGAVRAPRRCVSNFIYYENY